MMAWGKNNYDGTEGGQCLEAVARFGTVRVRCSKAAGGPTLSVSSQGRTVFIKFAAQN